MRKKPDTKRWDPAWSRYAGLYRTIWGDQNVVELNRQLVLIDPLSDSPGENPLELRPQEGGQFLLEGKSGGNPVGEAVRFEEENGKVVRMIVGLSPANRVD